MGNYYNSKPNLLFAKDQTELLTFLEDARAPYDRAFAEYNKKKNKEKLTAEEIKMINVIEVFLKGVTEFQYFLKSNKYRKDSLYQIEREMDLYFLLERESDDTQILIEQKKIISWLEKNKLPAVLTMN